MDIIKSIVLFGIILIISNCVSTTAIPLSGGKYYPPTQNVLIFENEEDVEQPFEKLAIITSETGESEFVNNSKMIDKLVTKAKEIGADAIIFKEHLISGNDHSGTKTFRVTAIKFKG